MDILKSFFLYAFRPGYAYKNNVPMLSWTWGIILSWPFEALSIFYLIAIARFSGAMDSAQQEQLTFALLAVIVFPLVCLIKLAINRFCCVLILRVLGAEPVAYQKITGVLGTALASKFFLIIPVWGQILTFISYILIMLKGGKYEMRLTVGGSILILFATVLVILAFLLLALMLGLMIYPLVSNFA